MLPYRDTRLSGILLSLFFIVLIGYGYFEMRALLWGPRIEIGGRASISHDPLIRVAGTASHIASLSMNGRQIPVSEDGSFSEPYLLAPGYNRVILSARDTYGATQERVIEVIYQPITVSPDATNTPEAATSTPEAGLATPMAPAQ